MLGVVITLAVIAAVAWCIFKNYYPPTVLEGEENFVGDSEIIALGGASNETKDRPLG